MTEQYPHVRRLVMAGLRRKCAHDSVADPDIGECVACAQALTSIMSELGEEIGIDQTAYRVESELATTWANRLEEVLAERDSAVVQLAAVRAVLVADEQIDPRDLDADLAARVLQRILDLRTEIQLGRRLAVLVGELCDHAESRLVDHVSVRDLRTALNITPDERDQPPMLAALATDNPGDKS